MQKTMKIVSVLLMVMMLCFSLSTVVNAVYVSNIINEMDNSAANSADETTGIATLGGQITSILSTVGIVVAVIVILILGIKYMMGSASEKAEYKKTMIPYLVGALLVLGGSSIVRIVFSNFKF